MSKLFKVYWLTVVVIFFYNGVGAQSKKNTTLLSYQALVKEKNIQKLPNLILELAKNSNDSILQLSLQHIQKLKVTKNVSRCETIYLLLAEGYIHQNRNEFQKAITVFNELLKKQKSVKCSDLKSYSTYNNIGACFNYLGKNTEALKNYQTALSLAEKSKDTPVVCATQINIGNIYFVLNKIKEAEQYYRKSLETSSLNKKYNFEKAHALIALGTLFLDTSSDMQPAIAHFTEAIEIFNQLGLKDDLYHTKNNLGIAYSIEGNHQKALAIYEEVLAFATQNANKELIGNVSLDMAYTYNDLNNIEMAISSAKKSYDNYGEIGLIDGMVGANNLLSSFYKKQNNFEKAYEHLQLFTKYKDSLNKASKAEELMALKKDYEFGIEREHLNNEVLNYKLRNTILIVSLICLALLTGLFFLIRKRKALKAEAQKQEQFTFQLLQNTEEERSRIANELHDSVNHNLLTLKNSLSNGKTIEVQEVANVIEEVRNISRNLHPAILETVGLEASIENLCERLTEVGLFTTCEIEYHQKLSKNKELQLYRIIQEALNNTLKHGKANAAKVQLTSQENHLHIEIKDNGNGFDVNEQLKNPKSFGLQSILQRAKAIMAKINIDSSAKGTVILLKIPI